MALHLVEIFDRDTEVQESRMSMQIFDYDELLSYMRIRYLLDKAGLKSDVRVRITRE